MDEDALIAAALEGSPHAGTFLVSVFGPRLLGYCRSQTPDLSDTDREMICEQAVEIAVRKIETFDRAKGTFEGWLRGFVRYTVMNWRRASGQRHPDPVEDLVLQKPQTPVEPNDLEVPSPRVVALREAVSALSEADQVYLNLRYTQGLPTKAIATLVDKSDDAVRQRLSRSLRRLANQLEA